MVHRLKLKKHPLFDQIFFKIHIVDLLVQRSLENAQQKLHCQIVASMNVQLHAEILIHNSSFPKILAICCYRAPWACTRMNDHS